MSRMDGKKTQTHTHLVFIFKSAKARLYVLYDHTYSKGMDQSRLRIWSREAGSAVPSRVSLLIFILRLNLLLTYGIPPEFRGGVHLFILNRHTLSGQFRVYRVTQLRTDGVHCRASAGTGSVNLKVAPNECCLGRSPWTN